MGVIVNTVNQIQTTSLMYTTRLDVLKSEDKNLVLKTGKEFNPIL